MAKFCVDCQHYEPDERCAASHNLVTGIQSHNRCEDERSPVIWAQCGMEGKLFKRRGEAETKEQLGRSAPLNIAGGSRRDLKPGRSDG